MPVGHVEHSSEQDTFRSRKNSQQIEVMQERDGLRGAAGGVRFSRTLAGAHHTGGWIVQEAGVIIFCEVSCPPLL